VPVQLPTLSIFVSSTWHDLRPERAAVVEALNRLRRMKFVGMEFSGAWDEPPLVPSLKEARECDAYVGIIGGRYGSGITAEEYRAARAAGRKCFVYVKDSAAGLEVDDEAEKRLLLQAFVAELEPNHTRDTFAAPEDLALRVAVDLSNWYARTFLPQWASEHERLRVPGFTPYQLPSPPPDFVGRRAETDALLKALAPSEKVRVAGVCGMGGTGKTTLALAVAEKLRDDYPHAQLFVELHSMRAEPLDIVEALKRCIKLLGDERTRLPDSTEELSKIYRDNLSSKRALILLDDAAEESQLKAFMPPRGCALLVTSREKLIVPGITNVRLAPFSAEESHALLTFITPRAGTAEAEQIAGLCGHLPLALRLSGSLLADTDDLAPEAYVRQLRDERTRLGIIDKRAGRTLEIGVEATLNISYERLRAEVGRTFRRLSVFPATFDRRAEEAVCGDTEGEHLSNLTRLSLVIFDDRTRRYRLHDLVRLYAGQLLTAGESGESGALHSAHFLEVAREVEELSRQEVTSKRGIELFDAEWENLRAGRAWAARHLTDDGEAALSCLHYTDALKRLLYLRRHPREQVAWMESALAASRVLKQPVSEGRYQCHLGSAYSLFEPRRAVRCYLKAIAIACKTQDRLGLGNALGGLGNTYAGMNLDERAVRCYEGCLRKLYEHSDGRGAGRVLTNIGNIYARRRQSSLAAEFYSRALEVAREMCDRRGQAVALCNLAGEKVVSGEYGAAVEDYCLALSLMTEEHDLRGQAAALDGLGTAYSALSDHKRAVECFRRALEVSREVGDSFGEGVALGSLGNEYATQREFDEAVRCHEQALALDRRLGERRGVIEDLTNLGNVYYMAGDARAALTFHFEALTISRETAHRDYEGVALWNIAQALDKSDDARAAQAYAAGAFEILGRLRHPLSESVRKFLTRGGG
jgi:tetratricopeptide (TPR) repeat protein